MTLDIKLLEKVTGYKIKRNFESIGVDTATRTGIAILTTGENVAVVDYQFLEYDKINKKERYKHMVKSFEDIIIDENLAVVEDVFVGLNRKGSVELARYGAFVISECIKKEVPFEIISAVSARAKLKINTRQYGKGKSKLAVSHWLKSSLGIELEDEDISDAIVLSILGLCEGLNFEATTQKKKRKVRAKAVGSKVSKTSARKVIKKLNKKRVKK